MDWCHLKQASSAYIPEIKAIVKFQRNSESLESSYYIYFEFINIDSTIGENIV